MCVHFYLYLSRKIESLSLLLICYAFIWIVFFSGRIRIILVAEMRYGNMWRRARMCMCKMLCIRMTISGKNLHKIKKTNKKTQIEKEKEKYPLNLMRILHWYRNSAHPWNTCRWWFETAIETKINRNWKEIETIVRISHFECHRKKNFLQEQPWNIETREHNFWFFWIASVEIASNDEWTWKY